MRMDLLFGFLLIISIITSSENSLSEGATTNLNVVDFGAKGDGQTDDSHAFLQAWKTLCGVKEGDTIPTLTIPQGKTFLLQPVRFEGPCSSKRVQIQFLGKIIAPRSINAWNVSSSGGRWLSFSTVTNLTITGPGQIDGNGLIWWNKDINSRPTALHFNNCDNLQLIGTTHINSPRNHISITGCTTVTIRNIQIIAPIDSPNTDGIDISDSNLITIHDSNIGTGDDCIAINANTFHVEIFNVNCGPGHGISVGSLGANGNTNTVNDVRVRNCTFTRTQNGARIKTWEGGKGFAKNIHFENITLIASDNPIIIDQHYCNGDHSCKEGNSAVSVDTVTYKYFSGTSKNAEAIVFNCSSITKCTNIQMDHINITSSTTAATAYCKNVQGTQNIVKPEVPCLTKG